MNERLRLVAAATTPRPSSGRDSSDSRLLDDEVLLSCADRRLLAGPRADGLEEHLHRYGPRPQVWGAAAETLLHTVDQVRLTGRGGAHFPVSTKWRTAMLAAAGARGAVVVANAAEGEPASGKDAALLRHRPHLVLDGLVCVAELIGADRLVVWLHEGANDTYAVLAHALRQRRIAGLQEPAVHLLTGPDHYLTGESSAVIAGVSGGRALPGFTRVPAARSGVDGLPTLVHNVETLARVALLARHGVDGDLPGVLVSVLGTTTTGEPAIAVRELPPHVSVERALVGRWVGPAQRPQAVLVGGYGGTWLRWDEAARLPLGALDGRRVGEALGPEGASLGAGILAPLPGDACGVVETAAVVQYLADSSARQCGPCLHGTQALADLWWRIVDGTARRSAVDRLLKFSSEVDRRGACALPDATARLTRSALRVFGEDVLRHLDEGGCAYTDAPAVLPVPRVGAPGAVDPSADPAVDHGGDTPPPFGGLLAGGAAGVAVEVAPDRGRRW